MAKKDKIVIGDKIDLRIGNGPYYRTTVDEMSGNSTIFAAVPSYKGIPIILHIDQELRIFFYRKSGRFSVHAQVKGFTVSGEIRLIEIEIKSEPKKEQRRESFRVPTSIKAVLCVFSDPITLRAKKMLEADDTVKEVAEARNLSETGVGLKTKFDYNISEKVLLKLHLAWPHEDSAPIELLAEARRSEYDPIRDIYYVGFQFLNAGDEMRSHISKYLLVQQQKQIKQQKLVEED